MGQVTEILLVTMEETTAGIEFLNAHLVDQQPTLSDGRRKLNDCLNHVNHAVAGTKGIGWQVYAAGYNYLDLEAFICAVAAAPWECAREVVLVVRSDATDMTDAWQWSDIAARAADIEGDGS